jgi:hypothetical protein
MATPVWKLTPFKFEFGPYNHLEGDMWNQFTLEKQVPIELVKKASVFCQCAADSSIALPEGWKLVNTNGAVLTDANTNKKIGPACTVYENEDSVFLVWVGDPLEKWYSALGKVKYVSTKYTKYKCDIRSDVYQSWEQFAPSIMQYLNTYLGKKKLYITGHSGGAEMAIMNALAFSKPIINGLNWNGELITFGAIPIGKRKFARYINMHVRHIRVVNCYDPVPARELDGKQSGSVVFVDPYRAVWNTKLTYTPGHIPMDVTGFEAMHGIKNYVDMLANIKLWSPAPTFTSCCCYYRERIEKGVNKTVDGVNETADAVSLQNAPAPEVSENVGAATI